MKNSFPGYYRPTEEEFSALWKNGLVVLDTNVLLDLYRLPAGSSKEVMSLFRLLKGRLWIPHQVGLEFHRNRLSVIARAHKDAQELFRELGKRFGDYRSKIDELQLGKRGVDEIDALLLEMESASKKIEERSKTAVAEQLNPNGQDSILEALEEVLKNCVGPAPSGQSEIEEVYKNAAARFSVKMGPGYMDDDKDKGLDPKFMSGGLVFERRYSDYLLWTQIISHVAEYKIKSIIFVTSDEKEDWWTKVSGGFQAGPLPELREEMRAQGGVEIFWMYTLKDFLKRSVDQLHSKVSQLALSDVASVDEQARSSISRRQQYNVEQHPNNQDVAVLRAMAFLNYSTIGMYRRCQLAVSAEKKPGFAIFVSIDVLMVEREFIENIIIPAIDQFRKRGRVISEIYIVATDPQYLDVENLLHNSLQSFSLNDKSSDALDFVDLIFFWDALGEPVLNRHFITPF
ncbi:PIN-like domain-containing protein [Xanthomonas sp. 10-10]|uniref:PIN-like domain-containing protein n=1 Tax=Xanthomonas sp. 10-10 TaxID=3115848 RepID=A0AAU7P8U7_9XANT